MSKPRINQKINLTIESLGANGEGVGYWHGYRIFVDGALPGETLQARLFQRERNFGRAQILHLDNASPMRVIPPCPLFGKCGGCQVMHIDYNRQLSMKQQRVQQALNLAGESLQVDALPCIPSPDPSAYRNKIQLPVGLDENGMLTIGLYKRNSHDLVDVDNCRVHCVLGEKVYQEVRGVLKGTTIIPYDKSSGTGELRYVLIKTAINTEQVLITLVINGKGSTEIRQAAKEMMRCCNNVKGIVLNINSNPGNVVLGNENILLEGVSAIEERLHNLYFKVSSASFFQINTLQAERLYAKVIELADLKGSETVLDAYCGVGTLSLLMSAKARKVIGIECIPEAISDAKENAARNNIENTSFICGNAESSIASLEKIDVAIVNPPRKGCELSFLQELSNLKPKTIIYISCDPDSLVRDLLMLRKLGYHAESIQPFDMFPQTSHVESVVKLTM